MTTTTELDDYKITEAVPFLKSDNILEVPTYNPDPLFDLIMKDLNLKNDAALARALQVAPPMISKVRHRRLPLGPRMLIFIHELCGYSFDRMRELTGLQGVRL